MIQFSKDGGCFLHIVQTENRRQSCRNVTMNIYLRVLQRRRMSAAINPLSHAPLRPAQNELYICTFISKIYPIFYMQKYRTYRFSDNSAHIKQIVSYIICFFFLHFVDRTSCNDSL